MSGNTFGKLLTLTTFGESHGAAVGGIIDGFPAGIKIDTRFIENELHRRRPGHSSLTSPRAETDTIEILSGILDDVTLGTPIGFIIKNTDQKTADYQDLKDVFRPSHADFTYQQKFGIRDHRGGGRASARETAVRVAGGAFAKIFLQRKGIKIFGYTRKIGPVEIPANFSVSEQQDVERNEVRCPHPGTAVKMIEYIEKLQQEGDSTGGVVGCLITGVPPGIGEPVFNRLQADLASAVMSINAAKGFEYGMGFHSAEMKGSEHNDPFKADSTSAGKKKIQPATNKAGGILGGISTGEDIYFNVAFKPPSSINKQTHFMDEYGNDKQLTLQGRYDPCVIPRAVPVVEAMAALVIADHMLIDSGYHL